jgi:hypothetical protein
LGHLSVDGFCRGGADRVVFELGQIVSGHCTWARVSELRMELRARRPKADEQAQC